jgi:hypothetical protein
MELSPLMNSQAFHSVSPGYMSSQWISFPAGISGIPLMVTVALGAEPPRTTGTM